MIASKAKKSGSKKWAARRGRPWWENPYLMVRTGTFQMSRA